MSSRRRGYTRRRSSRVPRSCGSKAIACRSFRRTRRRSTCAIRWPRRSASRRTASWSTTERSGATSAPRAFRPTSSSSTTSRRRRVARSEPSRDTRTSSRRRTRATPRGSGFAPASTLEGYRVPAARHEAATVYTNNVPGGHMRAPGQPQNVFASESHLDLIARELGIMPLELRRRNVARAGDPTTSGEPWHGPDLRALLDRAAAEIRADQPRPAGRGIGFALGVRHVGRGSTTISLRLERDGTIEARTGVGDQGGGQHTLIQRIVAATLGIDPSKVRVRRLSTEGPQDPGIGGSRVTPVHGGAALAAARALQGKLDGRSVAEAARALGQGEAIEVSAKFDATAEDHGACAHAIEVTVDVETGTVRVLSAMLAVDVGQVINPVGLRGQLEGGFVYGLGMALTEDLAMEDGRVRAANLGDYKLPTIADVPPLRIVHLSDGHGVGPYGARSAAELGNPGVPAAVANAVQDASGARVRTLPITAERVWRALRAT